LGFVVYYVIMGLDLGILDDAIGFWASTQGAKLWTQFFSGN